MSDSEGESDTGCCCKDEIERQKELVRFNVPWGYDNRYAGKENWQTETWPYVDEFKTMYRNESQH